MDLAPLPTDELDNVRAWRLSEFKRIGYAWPDAEELADEDVDLREIERLILMGCPPDTARRIAG